MPEITDVRASEMARELVTVFIDQSDSALTQRVVLAALAEVRNDADLQARLVTALLYITARSVIALGNQHGLSPIESWRVLAARLGSTGPEAEDPQGPQ